MADRVTQVSMEVLATPPSNTARVTQVAMEVLVPVTPLPPPPLLRRASVWSVG